MSLEDAEINGSLFENEDDVESSNKEKILNGEWRKFIYNANLNF